MQFGIGLPNYGKGKTFDDIKRVALAAEELGYESVWTTDHIIVPRENIEPYGHIFESLMTLALVAPITQRVKLGTSILVLPQRNPVLAAKQVATLDAASGGRVILGVAVGWNETEFKNLGENFHSRGKRLDEAIALLRTLWSNDDATFNGKYTQLEHAVFAPLPTHRNIPIWIGGNEEHALVRAAKLGDGWHSTGASPEQVLRGVQRIQSLKPARPITVSVRVTTDLRAGVSPTYAYRGNPRMKLVGNIDMVRLRLREYAHAGATHMMLVFPYEDMNLALEHMKQFAAQVMPEFK